MLSPHTPPPLSSRPPSASALKVRPLRVREREVGVRGSREGSWDRGREGGRGALPPSCPWEGKGQTAAGVFKNLWARNGGGGDEILNQLERSRKPVSVANELGVVNHLECGVVPFSGSPPTSESGIKSGGFLISLQLLGWLSHF